MVSELNYRQEITADGATDNVSAVQALEKGLDDLIDLCDIVDDKFKQARQTFANRME